MMTTQQIALLIARVAENDDQLAFKELFDYYSGRLSDYTQSIVNNAHEAEEIVVDVFVNLWKNRKMLCTIKNLSYYLHTACKNTAINYLQKQKKYASTSLDEVQHHFVLSYGTPETNFIEKGHLEIIISAIESLPPVRQLVFRLAKEDRLSYKEIAQLLNISIKTVENHMTGALRKIADVLRATLPEFITYYKKGKQ